MLGQTIGKYQLLDRVGRGGMGSVYRAIDQTLRREVAIKVINAELDDPEVARRFRAEAITVARLNHPGIATIYELFEHDGQWLMVMEFVRGETLEHLVDRQGPLPPKRAADLCMQALAALTHAHGLGVVHRDLKPANLMITDAGVVKVMDFGIARVSGSERLTTAGYMMGTPAYMAPEQVLGHEIDARADLYAMGVVFYRLATGRLPFKGETPFAMAQSQVSDPPTPMSLACADLPTWAEQIAARALAKQPDARFQSAAEFHAAFAACLAGAPLPAPNAAAPAGLMITPSRAAPATFTRTPTPAETPTVSAGYAPLPVSPTPGAASAPVAAASPAPASRTNVAVMALAGAVLVLAVLVIFVLIQSSRPAPATGASAQVTPAPSNQPASPPAPAPPVPSPPAAANPPAPAGEAPGPAPGRAAGTSAARGTAGRGGAAPPVADEHVVFTDVKLLTVTGKKAQDQDVLVSFVGGQVSVLAKNGGGVMVSVPYGRIARATYVHAKAPRFDPEFTAPPAQLDMPGLFPTAHHWLALQTKDAFLALRLEDSNWVKVLDTVEARTGLKVDRSGPGR
jgi:serine/threonine-protein kinase